MFQVIKRVGPVLKKTEKNKLKKIDLVVPIFISVCYNLMERMCLISNGEQKLHNQVS